MKKTLFAILFLIIVIIAGELFSTPKTIIGQRNGQNVWNVNHFFDMYKTEYFTPINDTIIVVVTSKEKILNKPIVRVSDGNNVTTLNSYDVYNYVNVNDTVNLVTSYIPLSRHKYRIKYFVYK